MADAKISVPARRGRPPNPNKKTRTENLERMRIYARSQRLQAAAWQRMITRRFGGLEITLDELVTRSGRSLTTERVIELVCQELASQPAPQS